MDKKNLKRIGLVCLSLGMIFICFKPLEYDNQNSLLAGIFIGLAIGLIVSSYTKVMILSWVFLQL